MQTNFHASQPYQKIPDIYFLRSCSVPNFISILSPITIQFFVDVLYCFVSSIVLPIVLFGLTTTKLNKLYYYDTTWYGSIDLGPCHIVLDGVSAESAPCLRGTAPPSFRPMSIVATVAHLSYC